MEYKKVIVFILLFFCYYNISAQEKLYNFDFKIDKNNLNLANQKLTYKADMNTANYVVAGLLVVMVVNPIIELEDSKVNAGLTRELTLGFGKQGEYRASVEYSLIFKGHNRHQLRVSGKYDILGPISRGEFITLRSAVTLGAGYFRDAGGEGIFPEITAGLKIGESEYIIYPYAKLRHTFMLTKDKPGITDFSMGAVLGIKLF